MVSLDDFGFGSSHHARARACDRNAHAQAKKFVESVPQTLKENVPKDEAEKLMKTLQDLGATVSMS